MIMGGESIHSKRKQDLRLEIKHPVAVLVAIFIHLGDASAGSLYKMCMLTQCHNAH